MSKSRPLLAQVAPEIAAFARHVQRARQRARRRADIPRAGRCNPAWRRPRVPAMVMPSMSANGSPSMSMRSENVPESPSSALQAMYFCAAALIEHGLPLDAGGKRRAAAAAQARNRSPRARSRAAASKAPRSGPRSRRARCSRRCRKDPRRRGARAVSRCWLREPFMAPDISHAAARCAPPSSSPASSSAGTSAARTGP